MGTFVFAFLTACNMSTDYREVSLDVEPLDQDPASPDGTLRTDVAAAISTQGTSLSYSPLLDYLGHRLDRSVTLVQNRRGTERSQSQHPPRHGRTRVPIDDQTSVEWSR